MAQIPIKRSPCAIANGLEILGDRWSLLIVRDLLFTNRCEFGHLLHAGEGISTNILSDRLERLQTAGVIDKSQHPSHGKKYRYQLTEAGLKLAPTLIEFGLWCCATFDGVRMPAAVYDLAVNNREKLLAMVAARQPVIELPL
ncbi:winged helix-turn-helix transcriptional regulator [Halioxenophilus aromaticivorans]|uniref:HTH hxlR-type domain-containing protein n=1 Tax=Halioxenophilus aromaticivorans TaxID=1306992 RepID=A0AAV3U1R8_9ALTE